MESVAADEFSVIHWCYALCAPRPQAEEGPGGGWLQDRRTSKHLQTDDWCVCNLVLWSWRTPSPPPLSRPRARGAWCI